MSALLIRLIDRGPVLYLSKRAGKSNKSFVMPKLRTMRVDAPEVASHLLEDVHLHVTSVGSILRKYSLDELPQFWSVLKGDMSLVGPRPILFSQVELIDLRAQAGVSQLLPGITGWAQINGRDALKDDEKLALDIEYMQRCTLMFDIKILALTVIRVIKAQSISH